jgi:large subunit ribosomal protein L13
MVVIDASGAVVGRLSARVAKLLLSKQEVELINADKALMVGSLGAAKEKYSSRRRQQNKRTPEDSPVWPRAPHMLLRRIVRGMLPYKSQRGRDAYRRLKVVVGAPSGAAKPARVPEASSEQKHGTFTLSELCKSLGGSGQ